MARGGMIRKHEEHEEKPEGMERWLLTYADMITLLMLFFIVLYAMSSVSQKKLEELSASLGMVFTAGRIIIDFGNNSILPSRNVNNNMVVMKDSEKTTSTSFDDVGTYLSKTYKDAFSMFQSEIATHKMRIFVDRRGIIIQLGADMFFAPGSADVNPSAETILKKLSLLFSEIPNKLRIEGHTDSRPLKSDKFDSNWELSSQRAINILKMYKSLGIPESRMMAVAYSDTKPLVTNDTPEGRAFNRRVDIVIIDRESQE